MKHIYLLLFAITFAISGTFAQRNCGTMDHLHDLEELDPSLRERMEKIENHTRVILDHDLSDASRDTEIITIPVVVHVLYRVASENISDAQILSQIEVLNEDFRRLNSDASQTLSQFQGVAADSEVEFCMASIAPNGTSTNGITRTSTTKTTFGTNNSVKFAAQGGKDAWPTGQYLNIWVCNIGGGILGYAQFPGGAASTDGVVVDYRYIGTTGTATAPFNLGRTATHEVGHWLNLRHIWGDGGCTVDDFVADTPTSSSANYGCSLNTVKCSTLDMVQNYMDYTDDACMNIYTAGQKARMRALFAPGGARASLLSSTACGASNPPSCSDGVQNGTETGVDCGGSCTPCSPSSGCLTYCTSRGNSTVDEYIQSVTIGSYNNNSGNNGGYAAFNTTAAYAAGQSYNFTLVPAWTGTVYAEFFRIWADWNSDGDFNDTGELAFTQSAASTAASVSGSIVIPSTAAIGKTTFRVQMKYNAAPTNCETFSWGEVEDYCVNINPAAPVCSVPSGLNSTLVTASTATLSWQGVSGGTNYTVRVRPVGQSTWTSANTSSLSVNFSGFTACTNYEFQVSANCSGLASAYSASALFNTLGCAPQTCTQPSGLVANSITSSSAVLVWGAVSGATSYNVRARAFGATSWSTGTASSTSVNFTGLSVCTGYEFQIETVCSGGTLSGYSGSANFITPGCASCTAPTVSYMSNITSSSARFNWSAMPGATRYTLRYRVNGTSTWTTVNTTATTINRTGLLCGTTYQYQLRTRCGSVWTSYGPLSTFATAGCNREMEYSMLSVEKEKLEFTLFPNPASNLVNIRFDESRLNSSIILRVFDVNGRMVLERQLQGLDDSATYYFDTSALSNGIYMLQATDASASLIKRLVISK